MLWFITVEVEQRESKQGERKSKWLPRLLQPPDTPGHCHRRMSRRVKAPPTPNPSLHNSPTSHSLSVASTSHSGIDSLWNLFFFFFLFASLRLLLIPGGDDHILKSNNYSFYCPQSAEWPPSICRGGWQCRWSISTTRGSDRQVLKFLPFRTFCSVLEPNGTFQLFCEVTTLLQGRMKCFTYQGWKVKEAQKIRVGLWHWHHDLYH